MAATSIQWCDHSINPIRARHLPTGKIGHYCEMVSPGCAHCYSSNFQKRFGTPAFVAGQKRDEYEIFLDESKLEEVRRRRKPTRYFWEDMSDLFGDWVKPEWLAKCFATMDATPQHTHLLLTKRPENIRRMWDYSRKLKTSRASQNEGDNIDVFRANVFLGTSISDQPTTDTFVPRLLDCGDLCPVLFLSCEPLLGPIKFDWCEHPDPYCDGSLDPLSGWVSGDNNYQPWRDNLHRIKWVIGGGESGPGARPCDLQWIRSLRDQCQAAGVAMFIKQLGSRPFTSEMWDVIPGADKRVNWDKATPAEKEQAAETLGMLLENSGVLLADSKGGNWSEWAEDLRVRQFPKVEVPA